MCLLKKKKQGWEKGNLLTFDDISEQTEATQGPRQQQRNKNHVTIVVWVKIHQRLCSRA